MMPTQSLIDRLKNHKLFRALAWQTFLLLSLLWVLSGLLVNPAGEFPLNDDWAFARPVKTLCDEGRLELTEWPALTLIAHIVWGWLVSSIFGFSFLALRLSVALLGLGSILIAWQTLRELSGDEETAVLGALTIGFNAIFFSLSYTFMTDVPFFFCAMFSLYGYMRALRNDDLRWLAIATLSAAVAALIRQLGLFLPVSYALAVMVKERCALRSWVRGAGAMLFVYGALITYERWMEATLGLPDVYQTYEAEVWKKISAGLIPLVRNTADTLMVCMIYLGLFLFPLLLIVLPWRSRRAKLITIILTASGLALGLWLAWEGRKMPLLPQGIFTDFALGPPTLKDVFHLRRENLYRAPQFLLWLITCLGCVGAFWLLRHLCAAFRAGLLRLFGGRGDAFRASTQVFGISSALIILLPLAIKMPFDRYLLACVPGLLIGVAASGAFGSPMLRWKRWTAALFILGSAVFAVAGTHDYLAWNRARWQAVDYLCKDLNFPHSNVDGGMEFGGWHLYDPFYVGDGIKTWWWIKDDEFTVTFGLIENHRIIKSFPYSRWCPPRRDYIYVIERSDVNADSIKIASMHRDGGSNIKTSCGNILRYWNGRDRPVNIARGSFVCLEPGSYRARFTLAAGKTPGERNRDTGVFRVIDYGNGQLLAESEILNAGYGPRQFANQELPFCISTNLRVGVHVIGGNTPLWLDTVQFIKE